MSKKKPQKVWVAQYRAHSNRDTTLWGLEGVFGSLKAFKGYLLDGYDSVVIEEERVSSGVVMVKLLDVSGDLIDDFLVERLEVEDE